MGTHKGLNPTVMNTILFMIWSKGEREPLKGLQVHNGDPRSPRGLNHTVTNVILLIIWFVLAFVPLGANGSR